MCVVCLEEMAQVSESFMKTSRGLLSELLPLANGVRHDLIGYCRPEKMYIREVDRVAAVDE